VSDRKAFLVRLDPALLDALQRWANDEFRSLNGQIEFLLTRALGEAGRTKEATASGPRARRKEGEASGSELRELRRPPV
jgi:hypothetical protein